MHTQPYTETRRRQTGAKPVTPQTKIQMAFDAAEGDRQEAVAVLIEPYLNGDSLHDFLIERGAYAAVSGLVTKDRQDIMTNSPERSQLPRFLTMPAPHDPGAHARRTARRAVLEVKMLLDATLFGGKIKMADATREDLLECADRYEPQAKDMLAKVAYYRMVAARVPEGRTAGEIVDNETLTALLAQARRESGVAA